METKLKKMRTSIGMTQAELSDKSGVSLRTIQAYEQGLKDINKAQVLIVIRLAQALGCDIYKIVNMEK